MPSAAHANAYPWIAVEREGLPNLAFHMFSLADVGAEFLFQVISGRAERAALIVTTNLPFSERLHHGIRREELCLLRLRDMQSRQGVMHLRIKGKRDKVRCIPLALRLIGEYLQAAKHGGGRMARIWTVPSFAS